MQDKVAQAGWFIVNTSCQVRAITREYPKFAHTRCQHMASATRKYDTAVIRPKLKRVTGCSWRKRANEWKRSRALSVSSPRLQKTLEHHLPGTSQPSVLRSAIASMMFCNAVAIEAPKPRKAARRAILLWRGVAKELSDTSAATPSSSSYCLP